MSAGKRPNDREKTGKEWPATPEVDHRANDALLDKLIDTDGLPNRLAETLPPVPEDDEDEDEIAPND